MHTKNFFYDMYEKLAEEKAVQENRPFSNDTIKYTALCETSPQLIKPAH